MKRTTKFVVLGLLFIIGFQVVSFAQKLKILSPQPYTYVKQNELFIAVELLPEQERFRKGSVKILVDDYLVNFQAKVTDKKVTLIYQGFLMEGKHQIKLIAKTNKGNLPPLIWSVFIGDSIEIATNFSQTKNDSLSKTKFEAHGFVNLTTRNEFINGDGAYLRQEPQLTRDLSFNVEPKINNISFPLQGYFTTNQRTDIQSRNRYLVGFKSEFIEGYYGANYPVYDELLVTGARVDGINGIIKFRKASIHAVHGKLNQAIEGSLQRLRPGEAFIPSSLRGDSMYIQSGTYQQNLTAVRLNLGRVDEGATFGVTLSKVKDDSNSIQYGLSPRENVGVGFNQELISQNKIFSLRSSYAMSLTTNDYSRGALSDEEIDSLYKVELPFNPQSFSKIININTSTIPVNIKKRGSMAWVIRPSIRTKNYTLHLIYRRIGPEFQSFANPFNRFDLQEFVANNTLNFWKRKVIIQLNLLNNENNIMGSGTSVLVNNNAFAALTFSPHIYAPSLFISYRYNERNSKNLVVEGRDVNVLINTIQSNITYRIKITDKIFTTIGGNYLKMDRVSNNTFNDNRTYSYGGIFNQELPLNIIIGYNHSIFRVDNTEGAIQNFVNQLYTINYRLTKTKSEFGLSYATNKNLKTIFTDDSKRTNFNLMVRQDIYKGLSINLDAGKGHYLTPDARFNYIEQYVNGGLTFTF